MDKLQVDIFDCRSGDILAKDILSKRGLILAAENLILNDFIISKLKTMGIKSLWLYKEQGGVYRFYEKADKTKVVTDYKEIVLGLKKILKSMAMGKKLDIVTVRNIAHMIHKNTDNLDIILPYMNELKSYDDYSYYHCVNVAFYAMLIGKQLHMQESKIFELIQSGLLHDIGKVKIPSEILNKKDKLTDQEYEIIKKHCYFGFEMLKSSEINYSIKNAVLMHHERIDGSGYPLGIKGDSIDEYAKIMAIADVYDAMTSDRPYKKGTTPFEAFNMFTTDGLIAFDNLALNNFLLNFSTHFVGANVQLDSGDIGEIVYIPPNEMVNPIIRVGSSFIKVSRNRSPKIVNVV